MSFLDLLFPRECLWCSQKWAYLCFECKKKLVLHPELCPYCYTPSKDAKTCATCFFSEKKNLKGLLVGFAYQGLLKKILIKLKFYHKKDLGDFLAERMWILIQVNTTLMKLVDQGQLYLTYIPSHRYRHHIQKGYNQSEILTKLLAKQSHLPMLKLVKKRKFTKSQVALKRAQRFKNLNAAFSPLAMDTLPNWATVLLVDDITTTGATLNEVASVIQLARPDISCRGMVLARNI